MTPGVEIRSPSAADFGCERTLWAKDDLILADRAVEDGVNSIRHTAVGPKVCGLGEDRSTAAGV